MRSVERAAKRGMIRLARPLFRTRGSTGRIDRVLIVRIDDRLGNLLLLTPLLDWLRQRLPDARIGLVLSRAFAEIYRQDPRVDERIVIDKRAQKAFLPRFLGDLGTASRGIWDAVLECSDRSSFSFNHALYTLASRAPRRIGFANDLSDRYLTDAVPPPERGHAARDPLLLAGRLLGENPPPLECLRLRIHLPPVDPRWESVLRWIENGADGRIVGIHIGGRGKKRLSLDTFAEIADGLLSDGLRPWIFRGPMEEGTDAAFERAVCRGAVLVPRAGVIEIAQAISRCALVIGPDTGPMHLAGAVGARTLALFLSSDADRYHPLGPGSRWIDARGRTISAREVLYAAAEALADPGRVEGR